jgi:hypothetical protein
VQHLKNSPAFYGTRRFNIVFTRALHWSTLSHHISLRFLLILSIHLRLGLPSSLLFVYIFIYQCSLIFLPPRVFLIYAQMKDNIVTCMSDYRQGLSCLMDVLITYKYDSELQAITSPQLICTIRKSPRHFLSCCVVINLSLRTAPNSADSSASHSQVLPLQPPVQNWSTQS